jgi:trimethylamine:corrinoid methyltransferase-like protein
MSFEQFIIDLEIWGYFERLSRPVEVDEEHLALSLISELPANYLDQPHTLRHFKDEIYQPLFGKPQKPEAIKEVKILAQERLAQMEKTEPKLEPIDPAALAELRKYLTAQDPSLSKLVGELL